MSPLLGMFFSLTIFPTPDIVASTQSMRLTGEHVVCETPRDIYRALRREDSSCSKTHFQKNSEVLWARYGYATVDTERGHTREYLVQIIIWYDADEQQVVRYLFSEVVVT